MQRVVAVEGEHRPRRLNTVQPSDDLGARQKSWSNHGLPNPPKRRCNSASKVGVAVSTRFVAADTVAARSGFGGVSRDIGRCGRAEPFLQIALSARIADAKIMLSVLVEVLVGAICGWRDPFPGPYFCENIPSD
jgi:hypothetical protein